MASPTRVGGFPVSSSSTGNAVSNPVTTVTVKDLIWCTVKINSNTIRGTSVSGGGCHNWQPLFEFQDTPAARYQAVWVGTVATVGTSTVSVTYSGTNSFSTELGVDSWTGPSSWYFYDSHGVTLAGETDYGGTATANVQMPTLVPTVDARNGLLYWCFARLGSTFSSGLTAGFTHSTLASGNEIVTNPDCVVNTSYAPSFQQLAASTFDAIAFIVAGDPILTGPAHPDQILAFQ